LRVAVQFGPVLHDCVMYIAATARDPHAMPAGLLQRSLEIEPRE
jgi:hypothetical protein